jgi:hypothetical protein
MDFLHIRVNLLCLDGDIAFADRLQFHIQWHLTRDVKCLLDLNCVRVTKWPV